MARLATLILNPAAGRAPLLTARLPALRSLLQTHGLTLNLLHTTAAPESARNLALSALGSTCLFACGGDGTVHEVLQALAGTRTPLGILPVGTANALARNLGIPLDPVQALAALLQGTTSIIPLGRIVTATCTRFFAVMAGCGPDGALVHALPPAHKARFGRAAYYAHAAHLFATRRWPTFQVDYRLPGSSHWQTTQAISLLASRVPHLGGLFAGLTPHSRLDHPHLHLHLLRAPAHLALPAWIARLPTRLHTVLDAQEIRCTPLTASPIHCQADGELLGELPLSLALQPRALHLLHP